MIDSALLFTAALAYVAATCVCLTTSALDERARSERWFMTLIFAGLALHAAALAARWVRVGHGPFITMYEILASNIFSLLLIYALAYWRFKPVRASAPIVMSILLVMTVWLFAASPAASELPATYDTLLLYVHVLFGKIFLGAVLIAVGLSAVILLRSAGVARGVFAELAENAKLGELAYRFLALGFVFETLMLIVGAIWAQDAWGRYWAWDPLETWAFMTWLLLAFTLHLRIGAQPSATLIAGLTIAVFLVAFLTFFGVPFISTAPHKGAV